MRKFETTSLTLSTSTITLTKLAISCPKTIYLSLQLSLSLRLSCSSIRRFAYLVSYFSLSLSNRELFAQNLWIQPNTLIPLLPFDPNFAPISPLRLDDKSVPPKSLSLTKALDFSYNTKIPIMGLRFPLFNRRSGS